MNKSLKQQWINYRNTGNIEYSFFLDFYNEHCKKDCLQREEFVKYFPLYWNQMRYEIEQHLDSKYIEMKIFNKKGQLIWIK